MNMKRKRELGNRIEAYFFILPAFLVFTIVIVLSALLGFAYSFTDWNGLTTQINFIGLANFQRMFSDKLLVIAVKNTVLITLFNVVLQNVIALLMAVFLDKKLFGRNFFRTLFFIPSLLSTVIVGFMWVYILNPVVGSLPFLFKALGLQSFGRIDFLGNPQLAIYTIIGTLIWQYSGYKMVIYLSGLQSIPNELYEASDIDGVNPWQRFFKITFPLIAPSVTINVFLTLVNTLKLFEHVYIMTNGGPGNATETVATMIYNVAFSAQQMGYGTAVSSVLFLAILAVAVIQVKYMRNKEISL